MIFLYILLSIIALFVLILSFNLCLFVDYDEVLKIRAKWLFVNISLFPPKKKEKKPPAPESPKKLRKKLKTLIEKDRKPGIKYYTAESIAAHDALIAGALEEAKLVFANKKAVSEELSAAITAFEEAVEAAKALLEFKPGMSQKDIDKDKKAAKKRSPLLVFYDNEGFEGILNLLQKTADALGGMFKTVLKHFIVRELFIDLCVTGSDAADTAIKYGKACEKAFPALGLICSQMKVKEYNANIYPDFLARKDKAEYYISISLRPIFLTNATVVLLIRLLFKVVLKFIFAAKKKPDKQLNKPIGDIK